MSFKQSLVPTTAWMLKLVISTFIFNSCSQKSMKIYGTYPGVHADVQIAMKIYGTYPGVHADVQFAMKIYGTYPGIHADVQIAIGELVAFK